MVPGTGLLRVRGADPFALMAPTTVQGAIDDETGTITGAGFASPSVTFERRIEEPAATATIVASFTQVTPDGANGAVDAEGNVVFQEQLKVDLDISVVLDGSTTPLGLGGDCSASPVNIGLSSMSPYDPETGRVVMADSDFTVPEVVAGPMCDGIIADKINLELAGPGHSLSLVLEGPLPLPPLPGCATTTTLEVAPAAGAPVGDEVTLSAAVAPVASDLECTTSPATVVGFVDFRDGNNSVGIVAVDGSGAAGLTTSSLAAGTRSLRAVYIGSPPFQGSESAPTSYLVSTKPLLTTTLPEMLEIGAASVEFDLGVSTSELGVVVDGARMDLSIAQPAGFQVLGPNTFVLEYDNGDTWIPVSLTSPAPGRLIGSIGAAGTFDHEPGEEAVVQMRLSTGSSAPQPAALTFTHELVPAAAPVVVASNPAALGSVRADLQVVSSERVASSVGFGLGFQGGPVAPHTARQGYTFNLPGLSILPQVAGSGAGGTIEVLLDGAVLPVATFQNPTNFGSTVPVFNGGALPIANLPASTPTGPRTLTVRYSGDARFMPAQADTTIYVVPGLGREYECTAPGIPPIGFRALVRAQANLPRLAVPGATVPVSQLDVTITTDRSGLSTNALADLPDETLAPVGGSQLKDVSFAFDEVGEGAATGLFRGFGTGMQFEPIPATNVDQILDPRGETGSVTVDGPLGSSVSVDLTEIAVDIQSTIGVYEVRCRPVDQPVHLGSVTVAGLDLMVDPAGPVREGTSVELTAMSYPTTAGTVVFRNGGALLGVVPVDNGVARMVAEDLAEGTHEITAKLFPNPSALTLTSPARQVEVLPETDCAGSLLSPEAGIAVDGNAAVVRLVYMELLGRCPDHAGFDYWAGRLDGGTTAEEFARTIVRTSEAVGRVVDDAYRTMLGRPADPGGRAFWIMRLRSHGRYDRLLADLGSSEEFWALAGSTNEGSVTRIYGQLVERAPDQPGFDYWVGRLYDGTSRRALVLALANLDEPLGVLVSDAYDEILDRVPSGSERTSGITYVRRTGDRSGLYAQLIRTPEFHHRAQTFPNF